MTRFERHLGRDGKIEIDGEEFTLKLLGTKYMPEMFTAMKHFGGLEVKAANEKILNAFTPECTTAIQTLVEATLEKSFPEEWKENAEEVKEFGMKNMMVLMPKIFELNGADASNVEKVKKDEVIQILNKTKS